MLRRIALLVAAVMTLASWGGTPLGAQQTEPRIAFVVGNSAYRPGALPTALNDAGLVAEVLRSIGFEIVEGADLSQPDMLRAFRDFLAKVEASGPDTLAFVYFSGHGLSFEGDNYLLGVDARLQRESDIPIEAVRLSDLLRPLADSPARAKVVMIDAARPLPFRPQGRGLAPGLEAVEAPQGMLIAFSSAPGTIAPDGPGPYGAYATAIAEMLRAPGIDLETAFIHIRSRTHLSTQGRQTPWNVSNLDDEIELVPPDAVTASLPPPPPPRELRPMGEIGPDEAYALAIEMDTLEGYVDFVDAYPRHPYAERIWAMLRARREALAWMRALQINSPQAYWTYLRRYPNGIYAFDADRRLRRLRAPFAPPPGFVLLELAGVPLALLGEPREYRPVYRVGPPPPRRMFRPPPSFLANLPPPRRVRPRGLPTLSAPIPAVPRLAPAPRRPRPAAIAPGARPGTIQRPGARQRPAVPPAGATRRPPTAVPATPAPGAAPPPAALRPPRAVQPPGPLPSPPSAARPVAPPPTSRPPVVAPPAVRQPPSVAKPPAPPKGAPPSAAPRAAPPPAVKPPAPPKVTPPAAVRRPPPPSAARPAPPPRHSAPPAAAARRAPPPARVGSAPPAKQPACPAGKSLVNGACK